MEDLFSYGTLQLTQVERELFGRILEMYPDGLVGSKREKIKIKVASVVNLSGKEEYVIISDNGDDSEVVDAMVLCVTHNELKLADEYEPADYERIRTTLKSDKASWVCAKKTMNDHAITICNHKL